MGISWFPDVGVPIPGADGAPTQRGGTGYPSPPEGPPPARAAASPPARGILGWLIRLGLVTRG